MGVTVFRIVDPEDGVEVNSSVAVNDDEIDGFREAAEALGFVLEEVYHVD